MCCIFVSCLESCPEGQIFPLSYLQDSVVRFYMVPGACLGGQVGSLCSVGFDDADAEVVCRLYGASLNVSLGECPLIMLLLDIRYCKLWF